MSKEISVLDKDMALIALRYAWRNDSQAADIVVRWYKKNIEHYHPHELIFLLEAKSGESAGTRKEYQKKEALWNEWSKLIRTRLSTFV